MSDILELWAIHSNMRKMRDILWETVVNISGISSHVGKCGNMMWVKCGEIFHCGELWDILMWEKSNGRGKLRWEMWQIVGHNVGKSGPWRVGVMWDDGLV